MKPTFIALCLPLMGANKPLTKEESAKVIEAAIRKRIKKPEGNLPEVDLEKVPRLYLINKQMPDVTGLEKLTSLRWLWLNNNQLTEIAKDLEKLTQLTHLDLNDNQLTDVKGLEKLTRLKSLYLGGNQLTSVKGLEKLPQLEDLGISDNQLTDVKGLEKLTQLKRLDLRDNKLTDVKGLKKLTQLKVLNLNDNKLTSVKGLEDLTQLTRLDLRNNPDLTKAQIAELQKALPNCRIRSNPKKQSFLPVKIPQRLDDLNARPEDGGISP